MKRLGSQREFRRWGRKFMVAALMNQQGLTRYEARRQVFGATRREATSHLTRGQGLIQQSLQRRLRLRAKRVQQVAAAQFTAAIAEGSL